jgi:hypothetical protein
MAIVVTSMDCGLIEENMVMSRVGSHVYNSLRWKTLSKKIRKDHPYCFICNKVEARLYVDHIVEIGDGGKPYDLNNLQVLCASCHTTKTNQVRGRRDMLSGGGGRGQGNSNPIPPRVQAFYAPDSSQSPPLKIYFCFVNLSGFIESYVCGFNLIAHV